MEVSKLFYGNEAFEKGNMHIFKLTRLTIVAISNINYYIPFSFPKLSFLSRSSSPFTLSKITLN